MKRFLSLVLVMMLACAVYASDGQVTGTIRTPQSAVPISNGTLTFTLSQAGVVAGSAVLSTSSINCATFTDGSIVGIKNPLFVPSVSTSTSTGSLAGTYYVKIVYTSAAGVSLPSAAAAVVVTGPANTMVVAAPAAVTGATGYKVYASATSGSETLQATTTGFVSSTSIGSIAAGGALPSTNTTQCLMAFNDSIIPTSTKYRVALSDSRGAAVPGFPFFVYLQGTLVDVSNGWPTARDVETRYFTPVVASPLSNAPQSVNSPLTLNGYKLSAGAIELTNNATPPATASGRTFLYTDNSGVAKVCENGTACVNLVGAGTNGWADAGNTVRTVTSTDMVLVGATSSDLAGTGTGNGSIISANAIGIVDGSPNGHFAGIVKASSKMAFASGVTGAQTTGLPMSFRTCPAAVDCSAVGTTEYGQIEVGGRWIIGSDDTTDISGGAAVVVGSFNQVNTHVNGTGIRLAAVNGAASITSFVTGTATAAPFIFWTGVAKQALKLTTEPFVEIEESYAGGTLSTAGTAALRNNAGTLQVSNNGGAWFSILSGNATAAMTTNYIPKSTSATALGTSLLYDDGTSILLGTTTASSADNHIETLRSRTNGEQMLLRNSDTGTSSYAAYVMRSGASASTNDFAIGITSAGYTPSGGFLAGAGFLKTGASAAGGIQIQTAAGGLLMELAGTTANFTFTTTSRLGIGATTPATALHVLSTVSEVARFDTSNATNTISLYSSSGTPRATLTASAVTAALGFPAGSTMQVLTNAACGLTGNCFEFTSGGTTFAVDETSSATASNIYIWYNGGQKQVLVGAADSCTAGYRCLRITN